MLRVRTFSLIFLWPLLNGIATAQVTGTYTFGPFDTPGFDTINRGNLNTHFSIPIFSKPGRGGSTFTYSLTYDGLVYKGQSSSGNGAWTPIESWGWNDVTNAEWGYITFDMSLQSCTVNKIQEEYSEYTDYVYHDSHGNAHPLVLNFSNTCGNVGPPTGTQSYTLTDSSGYTVYRSATTYTVFTASGANFVVPAFITFNQYKEQSSPGSGKSTDTNGNEISASSSGVFTDTMGITVLSVSGVAPNPVVYTYHDPNGNSQTVTVNYTSKTVQTAFGVSGVTEYSASNIPLVTSIVYSGDNSSYQFTYEQTPGNSSATTGRISSITLRTGGVISYSYGTMESDGTLGGLTRTTSDGATAYTRSGISSTASTTTILDAANNTSVSTMLINSAGYFFESDRKSYQGAATGTALGELQSCYNTSKNSCSGSTVSSGIASIQRNTFQNGTQVDEDYQQFSSAALLQSDADTMSGITTTYTYNSYTGANSIPFYRIATVASTGSETKYFYDQTTPASTSGLPQHVSVSTTRGNLTEIDKWTTSSGAPLITKLGFDDAGQVLIVTDPNSNVTKALYDSNSDTLLSQITFPTVNGNTFNAYITPDTNTGLPISSKDINSQTTSYSYDGMLRQSAIDYPDGGHKNFTYWAPNDTGIDVYQDSTDHTSTEILYDGYGRQSRVAIPLNSSATVDYQRDTCYDNVGNVHFTSYSYQGTGWGTPQVCSGAGGDTISYDGLHRAVSVAHGDGTSASYTYNGKATETTDENGVSRIASMLAPGIIGSVCEISSNSTMPGSGSPASCGMSIAGTGFLTTYAYNFATDQLTVTQDSGSSTYKQTRTFQTDWAGRPIKIVEPESGTTTYTYPTSQVVRTRPQANQTGSATTTTTTQYDALGRVTSISYSDGEPTKTFLYDVSTGWSNFSQQNLTGRLSAVYMPVTSPWNGAASLFSYDSMGRIVGLGECTPKGCGGTGSNDVFLSYTYDLEGNVLSSTDGSSSVYSGLTSTYSYSWANELLTLKSSAGGSQNPTTIISNMQSGPNGPSTYSFGNGLSGVQTYDALGRIAGGWACLNSTQAGCPGGTQLYGYTSTWSGVRETGQCDTVLNQCMQYGYDEFNRLTARTITQGTVQNYTYSYDVFGNRWSQNGGLTTSLSFAPGTNRVNTSGYTYDAAGNMTNDGFHSYTYDAEGNITKVDSGSTATYVYNALNQRVETIVGSTTTDFAFNAAGRRVSSWGGSPYSLLKGQYYWGGKPVAYYTKSGSTFGPTYFQHQDWLGTERIRTTYNGGVEGSFTSLPFGDNLTTASGSDNEAYHFAGLDHDYESDTDHAQFRQYSNYQGRWFSPDLYSGSYDFSNPQSMNRYAYVLNTPLSRRDPSGLLHCVPVSGSGQNGSIATCAKGSLDSDADDPASEFGYVPTYNIEWGASDVFLPGQTVYGSARYADGTVGYADTTIGDMAWEWGWSVDGTGTNLDFTSAPSTLTVPGSTPHQQQPEKKPCNSSTRIGGVIEAYDGLQNVSMMSDLAMIHFGAGVLLVGGACGTPEPGEPAVCAAGIFGGGSLFGGGFTLSYGAYMAAKDELIPGLKQAISCQEEE